MEINKHNIISAKVGRVDCGESLCIVEAITNAGNLTALISKYYVKLLNLAPGGQVYLKISPLDLYITKPAPMYMGVTNTILGRIRKVETTERLALILLDSDVGDLMALMSLEEWKNVGIREGEAACAAFKAAVTSVSITDDAPHQQSLNL